MGGWKTWTGAIALGVAAALRALGYPELAQLIEVIAAPLVIVGLGHKIEKARR